MFSYSFTLTSWKKTTVTERERPQYLVDIGAHTEVGEEKEKEIQEKGSTEQVGLPPQIFIMSCQSFLSAQQLSSALIPPNLPHSSLLSLF